MADYRRMTDQEAIDQAKEEVSKLRLRLESGMLNPGLRMVNAKRYDWLRRIVMLAESQIKVEETLGIPYDLDKLRALHWIRVTDAMPKEYDCVLHRYDHNGKPMPGEYQKTSYEVDVYVVFEDGSGLVTHSHTTDGKWQLVNGGKVTHWMPHPMPPKEEKQ